MAKILVIDDNLDICQLLKRFLTKKGHEVETTLSGQEGLDKVKSQAFDLIFCDFKLRKMEGRDVLKQVKSISPKTKVAIITGYADVKIAVEVIKNGAFDYVTKPLIPDELVNLIDRAMDENASVTETSKNKSKPVSKKKSGKSNSRFLKGKGPKSKKLYKEVSLVAPTDLSVIIYGESGAGKENIARSIHTESKRADQPFIAIDCGALSKELAGSELWGHEKGAFTGANAAKPGQFELADGGTIFLDEIVNLPYDVQVGLLRLVQEKKLRRVGGTVDKAIDVRIIVASNEDLRLAVKEGKFREDLYHRFNEFSLTVPALRERKPDIEDFAQHFLKLANEELGKEVEGFRDKVIKTFLEYSWPGNLREMRNVIRRAVLLAEGDEITLSSLPQEIVFAEKFNFDRTEEEKAEEMPDDLKLAAAEAEAKVLRKVLAEVKYNRTKAAKKLGIDRKTLFNKMKEYDI
ncbi:sigma-54-dependent transcriptional regulator [Algoriphagus namhaensis]|uniref:Sigma-54-dependent transcriptional regulator n=1 Tax=Algoriphagus namhaensis TaxID=915353 RepID=A0ABV8AWJ4_9BACT